MTWELTPDERADIARGVCPWSGDRLVRRQVFDGRADPTGDVRSCAVCDCFGHPLAGA